jgi:hypothetical protein
MIRYALRCADGHGFESWFQSADAYDGLRSAGLLECPDCGDTGIEKALMAPQVRAARSAAAAPPEETGPTKRDLALAELRKQVEANSDYVGLNFAKEARAIHDGDAPARSIYGEARLEEARRLIEDGVPVAPLPFVPRAKTN